MPTEAPEQLRGILERVRTIALVGASEKTSRPSHQVMAYLQSHGYRVIPVNPRLAGQTLLGETVVADLNDLPEPVDMVDLFLAPERTDPVIDQAIALGVPGALAADRRDQRSRRRPGGGGRSHRGDEPVPEARDSPARSAPWITRRRPAAPSPSRC